MNYNMNTTEALKNALEFAKQNPNSTEALQLRKRIESGMYKNELAQIKKVPFEHRNKIASALGAFLDPIIETGVRAGQAVGDLTLTGVNKVTGGTLDKYTPEGNLGQAISRAENTTTKVPVVGTTIKPVKDVTPENVAGNALKTVALGVSSPAVAGAGLVGGEALAQDKSAEEVAINTVVGALGGKVLELGFNAVAPYIEKAVLKYGQPALDKLSAYIPESAKGFAENLASKITPAGNISEKNILPDVASNAINKTDEALANVDKKISEKVGQGVTYVKSKVVPQTAKESVARVLKNTGKTTLGEASSGKKIDNAVEAFDIIRQNSPNITVKDINGIEKPFDPTKADFLELPQALKQTKDAVYNQYTRLATEAGDSGVVFNAKDFKAINKTLDKYSGKGYTPSYSNKAKQFQEAVNRFEGKATPEEIQGLIETVNVDVNPLSDKAGAQVANEFSAELRKMLDSKLESSGNPLYQATRDQYAKLKSIENDVINRYKEALRAGGAKPSLIDHITSMDALYGVLTGNPAHIVTGIGTKIIKNSYGKMFGAEANLRRTFKLLSGKVENVIDTKTPEGIVNYIKENGGISINKSGKMPESGYAVSPSKSTEVKIPVSEFNAQSVTDYQKQFAGALKPKDAYFGAWQDGENIVLDVSHVVDDLAKAQKIAVKGNQDAVYDVVKGESIPIKKSLKDKGEILPTKEYSPELIKKIEKEVFGNKTKAVIIDSDVIKKLHPKYDVNNPSVLHEESSAISKQLLKKAIDQDTSGVFKITGGGSASGKSEITISKLATQKGVVFDGTLSGKISAEEKINYALSKGKRVELHPTYTHPKLATVWNYMRSRSVPTDVLIKTHYGFRKTLPELLDKYGDKITIIPYRNSQFGIKAGQSMEIKNIKEQLNAEKMTLPQITKEVNEVLQLIDNYGIEHVKSVINELL